uniref:Protein kinase domain-containing protein n=1 Tax=Panagrolaimus superbus TaxID=310955 RepID=A0A914Y466_9BILA
MPTDDGEKENSFEKNEKNIGSSFTQKEIKLFKEQWAKQLKYLNEKINVEKVEPDIGETIQEYTILAKIGAGGFGKVFSRKEK